jgi:lipopolysaccharide export system permease protein
MRQLKRYVGSAVLASITMVLFVIVALDFIAGIVDQLGRLSGKYQVAEALIYVSLYIPSTAYEYIPLSALVGSMLGLGALANSSELTVIRAAGVTIRQVVWLVFRPVFLFIFVGTLLGEYVTPYLDQYADSRRALAKGHSRALEGEKGLWNREGNEYIHVNAVLPNGKLYGVTRYAFDDAGQLQQATFVDSAIYQGDYWFEQDAKVTRFSKGEQVSVEYFDSRRWETELSPQLLDVLVLKAEKLPMKRLYEYSHFLAKQNLDASEYSLAFWQKALQPLATLSLVVIAISFILGPLRQVTMGFRIFVGVIVGLVFQTSQQLLGPTSIILGFSPALAVLAPITACFFLGWLFLKRAE